MAAYGEEFYVLKFPYKLWRIVNGCLSSAINWNLFGTTILIDYNQFQDEYLECPVPKFKTRNMTSFVRQLNMYGFKKLQTQQRNAASRFCNIHEFFNENFRRGRPDLLSDVIRRTIPIKMERGNQIEHSMKLSQLEVTRRMYEDTLMNTRELMDFWLIPLGLFSGDEGENVIEPKYEIVVIPAEKLTIDAHSGIAVAEIISPGVEHLVITDPKEQLNEPEESDGDDSHEDGLNSLAFEMTIPSLPSGTRWVPCQEDVKEVKEGFDGYNYVVDVTGKQAVSPINPDSENLAAVPADYKISVGGEESELATEPARDAMIHVPEMPGDEDFYTSLKNAFSI